MQESRTMIGIQDAKTNKVTASYCTNKGYLSSTGTLLNETYNDIDLIREITQNGVSIKTDLGELNVDVEYSPPRTFNSLNEFQQLVHSHVFRNLYIYSEADNKWYVSSNDDKGFKPLTEELAKL